MGKIKTDKELAHSIKRYEDIKEHLKDTKKKQKEAGIPKEMAKLANDPVESFGESIKFEIEEYQSVKAGEIPQRLLKAKTPQDLGESLIALRIASGKSQSELAREMEVPSTQVCRDEKNEYFAIRSNRLFEILNALGYQIEIKKIQD